MTFFRISTDDVQGCVKAYLGEGAFINKEFNMDGGIAVCQNGFEHHVAMVRSHAADIVYEAVSKYLGWETYYHNCPAEKPTML